MKRFMFGSLALIGTGWLLLSAAWAQAPSAGVTLISIPTMDCNGCAKKVAAKVNEVPGVELVQVNLKDRTLVIVPKAGKGLSPLALWDAVERAGKQPAWLQGPHGTFKTKPTF